MTGKKGGLGKGLGKGLDLLISNEYVEKEKQKKTEEKSAETMLKIRLIEANSGQPRAYFDEDSLSELAESIKKYGVIQPIIVRKQDDHYEIVAGERRWRAAKLAGLKEIPAIIKDYGEQEMAEISLIENLQREDLNPIEEARAYQTLIKKYHLKQDEIAERVSKGRTVITNALRLLKLDQKVQEMLVEGLLTTGHAKVLLGLDAKEQQVEVAERIELETGEDAYHKRVFGFISEFLLLVWVTVKKLRVYECKVGMLGEKAETGELKRCLAECFRNRDVDLAKKIFLETREKRPDVLMEASDITGELHLCMQIIATAGEERNHGETMILERENDFGRLMEIFSKLNRVVSRYRENSESEEDIRFLGEGKISKTAVWVAVMMGKESESEKKDLMDRMLKYLH